MMGAREFEVDMSQPPTQRRAEVGHGRPQVAYPRTYGGRSAFRAAGDTSALFDQSPGHGEGSGENLDVYEGPGPLAAPGNEPGCDQAL
jgi:hypothetical protein